MNNVVLKDCPFCGGKAVLNDGDFGFKVYCADCLASVGAIESEEDNTIENAVARWNNRIKDARGFLPDFIRTDNMSIMHKIQLANTVFDSMEYRYEHGELPKWEYDIWYERMIDFTNKLFCGDDIV